MVRCTILADNNVRKSGLLAEHGLSLWIEAHGRRILFDTGQTWVFSHNATALGIEVEKADHVVLSHGHYDHTGGIPHFPRMNSDSRLYIHPDFFAQKFIKKSENVEKKNIGVSWRPESSGFPEGNIIFNKTPMEIHDGIMISGEIPRYTDFEEAPPGFMVKDKDGNLKGDIMLDEQMLIIEDDGGICIFLGCSHPGVVNCVQYALKLFPGKKILCVIGGMHLGNGSSFRLDKTIQFFTDLDMEKVIPLHCTGFEAVCMMRQKLGDRCLTGNVGDSFRFGS